MATLRQDLGAAFRDYRKHAQLLDRTLYGLCRKQPDHSSIGAINAKLWIISRTYATGIERGIPSKGSQGSSLQQLAKHCWSNHTKIEEIFSRLRRVREPLTPEKLKAILLLHGRFVRLLRPKMRLRQSPRSFASKYMHFHCPAVPLYDTRAVKALKHRYPWKERFEIFDLPWQADEEYGWYVLRFWQLYQDARKARKDVTVKMLDYYLLWVSGAL